MGVTEVGSWRPYEGSLSKVIWVKERDPEGSTEKESYIERPVLGSTNDTKFKRNHKMGIGWSQEETGSEDDGEIPDDPSLLSSLLLL